MSAGTPLVLITRPEAEAGRLGELLKRKGHSVFSEPMMLIRATQEAPMLLAEAASLRPQALVITSRHSLPLIRHQPSLLSVQVFVVGSETAKMARQMGFSRVAHAPTLAALLPIILRQCGAGDGMIVYLRGREITMDILPKLKKLGFSATQYIVYEANAPAGFTPTLVSLLQEGRIGTVTFLSERTVDIFLDLARRADISDVCSSLHAVCMSQKIAQRVSGPWKSVRFAADPTLRALVDAVDKQAQAA